jgi:hypothetical protein
MGVQGGGLVGDRRGVSTIEFAIIGPIVVAVIATVIEAAFLWSGSTALEAGGRAAARYGLTGAAEPGRTRTEVIRDIVTRHVCPKAQDDASTTCFWAEDGPSFVDETGKATKLDLEVRAYADPRNIGRPEPFTDADGDGTKDPGEGFEDVNGNRVWDEDAGSAGPGGPGDVVVYELAIHQAVVNPMLRTALGADTLRHATRVVIRNEPF